MLRLHHRHPCHSEKGCEHCIAHDKCRPAHLIEIEEKIGVEAGQQSVDQREHAIAQRRDHNDRNHPRDRLAARGIAQPPQYRRQGDNRVVELVGDPVIALRVMNARQERPIDHRHNRQSSRQCCHHGRRDAPASGNHRHDHSCANIAPDREEAQHPAKVLAIAPLT